MNKEDISGRGLANLGKSGQFLIDKQPGSQEPFPLFRGGPELRRIRDVSVVPLVRALADLCGWSVLIYIADSDTRCC